MRYSEEQRDLKLWVIAVLLLCVENRDSLLLIVNSLFCVENRDILLLIVTYLCCEIDNYLSTSYRGEEYYPLTLNSVCVCYQPQIQLH